MIEQLAKRFVRRDAQGAAHIVALSGGKDSTAMALRMREVWPDLPACYVCTPTGDELPSMVAHWQKLSQMLGQPIIPMNGMSFRQMIDREGALPNYRMRFCTRMLKVEPWLRFLEIVKPCVSYVGLRADEAAREGIELGRGGDLTITAAENIVTQRYPMQEWGWGLAEVQGYLASRGVEVPERTDCARCFYQTLGEWYNLWRRHPDIYASAEADEARFGHTYRSPGRDTWPASLRELRAEFERGRIPERSLRMMEKRKAMCRVCSL